MATPTIVVSGFLGSGKTTLLNALLHAAQKGKRIAVLVNDFGELGIDAALIDPGRTKAIELAGGCVCCLLSEDLEKSVLETVATQGPLDFLLIEASGVSEPLSITWTLEKESMDGVVVPLSIVTVWDNTSSDGLLQEHPPVRSQLEAADIVVVSKRDVSEAPVSAVVEDLVKGAVVIQESSPRESARRVWELLLGETVPSHRGEPGHHHHGYESVALEITREVDRDDLLDELEALPSDFFRVKGMAYGNGEWFVFHKVGGRVTFAKCESAPAKASLVAIGLGVSPLPLEQLLQRAYC